MAFAAHFSVTQGSDPQSFSLIDDSTGSDANLTTRTISLFLADGTLLGGSTIAWPISAGATKALTGYLTRDYVINISVAWTSTSPIPGSTYTYAALFSFTGNSNAFVYTLIQQLAAQESLSNDNGFFENLSKAQTDIDSAGLATTYGDQAGAQACLDRVYYLQTNQSLFF